MIIYKKYLTAFLFLLCSSGSIFSAYVFQQRDINTHKHKLDTQKFLHEDVKNEIHMPLFGKNFTTDFFDTSLTLSTAKSMLSEGENVGFLSLNKNIFIEKLKTFVYQQILKQNNSWSIISDHISGKIFYSFVDENSCNVVVKWQNTNYENSQTFYDGFLVFIDH